jgi:hypothetical protein
MFTTCYDALGRWALVLVCFSLMSCDGGSGHAGMDQASATSPSQKEEVVALIRQSFSDSDAWNNRVRMRSDRIVPQQAHNAKRWYKQYPVAYARERLISRGRSILPTLLEITRDPSHRDLHFAAWQLLANLDCPDYLKELYEAGKEKRITAGQVSALVETALPVRMGAVFLHDDKIMDWLGAQLAQKSPDQIVLDLLDELFTAKYEDGGLYPGVADHRVLKWLNRIYDIDLDSWLAQNVPAALKFRQEQLAKGYDPATSFNLSQSIADGLLDEAMAAIYPQPDDRNACRALLEAVYTNTTSAPLLRPAATPGWEQRLRSWYRGKREKEKVREKRISESAGQSRQGVADERAVRERARQGEKITFTNWY